MLEGIFEENSTSKIPHSNFIDFLIILENIGERLSSSNVKIIKNSEGKKEAIVTENSLGISNPFLVLEPTAIELTAKDKKDQKSQKSLLEI